MKQSKLCILVAEDEPIILEHLVEELGTLYHVETAADGIRAWSKAQKVQPDLVLLDITMPGLTGFDVCRKIRASANLRHTPVMFLTAHTQTDTLLKAFELGADDYLEKPFRMAELKARVAAKLRDRAGNDPGLITAGNLILRPKKKSAEVAGQEFPISALEYRLLKYFATRAERLVTREDILAIVWKSEAVSARTIDAHVVSLRKLLRRCDHEIASIYGEGYLFRMRLPEAK